MRIVDADAMMERLEEWNTNDKTDKALYNFAINRINEQPTIESEQQWIPCSERLPERPYQMLVYAMNTHFSIAKYKEVRKGINEYVYTWVTDNAFDVPHEVKNVIAWMPLPPVYRGE